MPENPSFCRNCGSPLNPGVQFCAQCGTPVAPAGAEPAAAPAAAQTKTEQMQAEINARHEQEAQQRAQQEAQRQAQQAQQQAQQQQAQQAQYQQAPYQQASPVQPTGKQPLAWGWAILGFIIPIVGLILFLVWRNDPVNANNGLSAGKGALVSVIVGIVFSILSFILTACVAGMANM